MAEVNYTDIHFEKAKSDQEHKQKYIGFDCQTPKREKNHILFLLH